MFYFLTVTGILFTGAVVTCAKVMMYMTLITAILVIAFRKINKISSFKIAKLRLSLELETTLIGQIVYLCGGDLDKFNNLYDP